MEYIKEKNRIYSREEAGKIVAEITFTKTEENDYVIDHTFVDESLRGLGIASHLVQMAVEQIHNQKGNVRATCPYAVKWLEKNKSHL